MSNKSYSRVLKSIDFVEIVSDLPALTVYWLIYNNKKKKDRHHIGKQYFYYRFT